MITAPRDTFVYRPKFNRFCVIVDVCLTRRLFAAYPPNGQITFFLPRTVGSPIGNRNNKINSHPNGWIYKTGETAPRRRYRASKKIFGDLFTSYAIFKIQNRLFLITFNILSDTRHCNINTTITHHVTTYIFDMTFLLATFMVQPIHDIFLTYTKRHIPNTYGFFFVDNCISLTVCMKYYIILNDERSCGHQQ